MNAEVAQIDVYSTRRADLIELLGKMIGGTTWREPFSGGSTNVRDMMPYTNRLGAALAYARNCNPADSGPDILEALATGTQKHRRKIVAELAAAMLAGMGRLADRNADYLPQIAADAFMACCGVLRTGRPEEVTPDDYARLTTLAERALWDCAEKTARRVWRKLR